MSNRLSFDYITQQATRTFASWSVRQRAQFEYFNPNGAYAAKKASDERVSTAVAAGKANSGAILAYGTFNDFYANNLADAVCAKSISRIHLSVIVSGIYGQIEDADRFLAGL